MKQWYRMNSFAIVMFFSCLFLFLSCVYSLVHGSISISWEHIWRSLVSFDSGNQAHQVIYHLRLPRILGALLVGAGLAVSGGIMQGMTKNPLADSGLLGINSGAAFGLAIVFIFFTQPNQWLVLFSCFCGACISMTIVYLVAGKKRFGLSPLRITLVGAGVSSLFVALSQALALQFDLGQNLIFWTLGGVSVISWSQLKIAIPLVLFGLCVAFWNSSTITVLRFGDEAAIGLGKNPKRIRLIGGFVVLILSGISVSLVGSISFVGLIVPHICRYFVGENYRQLLPLSAVIGAVLVVWSDFLARMLNPPFETPFGVVIAIIGIPVFLIVSRKGGYGS